jgi:hypothetical protein
MLVKLVVKGILNDLVKASVFKLIQSDLLPYRGINVSGRADYPDPTMVATAAPDGGRR